jgi:Tfp pilus assembly protein PilV
MSQGYRGVTLIEGLIAAAIITIAFLALAGLFPSAYSDITYGGQQTQAASFALQQIEALKHTNFDALDANCLNTCTTVAPGWCRVCVLTPNVGAGAQAGDVKKVQVTVTWPGGGRPNTLAVETLFTR